MTDKLPMRPTLELVLQYAEEAKKDATVMLEGSEERAKSPDTSYYPYMVGAQSVVIDTLLWRLGVIEKWSKKALENEEDR